MISCKNCTTQCDGAYCHHCGQKSTTGRITMFGLLADIPRIVFQVDKGIFYNFIQLFKRPGPAILDYLNGKRKVFFHPASYLLISLLLNYIVAKITNMHFYYEEELASMDSLSAQAIRDYDAMQWWFLEHTYIYILLAIPASSLLLYLCFRLGKRRFNGAECTVIVLFTIAQGVLIQTALYSCFGWVRSGSFIRTVESVNVVILILYASMVIYQLLATIARKWLRLLLSLLTGLMLAVVWVASAYLLYVLLT